MPEIKFVGCRLTNFTMAPQETKAVKRLHCEADFTAKVAAWLGVKDPGDWPGGWDSITLGAEDKTVTLATFEPSDSAMLALKFPLNVSLACDFKLKRVKRGEHTLVLTIFSLKTSNPKAASEIERWMDTGGGAECTIIITYPKQSEIDEAKSKESGQMPLGDAEAAAKEAMAEAKAGKKAN